MTMNHLVYLSAFVFASGLAIIITKRNAIMMLLGIELMLNAANLNLVVFNMQAGLDGQFFALFIIIIAVCEAAVGMALVLQIYRHVHTSLPDKFDALKEPDQK